MELDVPAFAQQISVLPIVLKSLSENFGSKTSADG